MRCVNSKANIQSFVNSLGIGPKIVDSSKNFIIMELIQGKLLSQLYDMKSLNVDIIRLTIKSLMDQCYRLDINGVDHGELSDLRKHVIINHRVNIIDFDSASYNRKTSNLTSCIQYIFIGGPNSEFLRKLFEIDLDNDVNFKSHMSYEKLFISLKIVFMASIWNASDVHFCFRFLLFVSFCFV